jgi:hypothetical protein
MVGRKKIVLLSFVLDLPDVPPEFRDPTRRRRVHGVERLCTEGHDQLGLCPFEVSDETWSTCLHRCLSCERPIVGLSR